MHRFQTVAQIGDRAGHDHRHGVIQIGGFHLLRDRDAWPLIGGGGWGVLIARFGGLRCVAQGFSRFWV